MAMHDSGRISRTTVAGLRPLCRHCGEEFDAMELVTPVVSAGPMRLYACPSCRKLSFREEVTAAPPRSVHRYVRELVEDRARRAA